MCGLQLSSTLPVGEVGGPRFPSRGQPLQRRRGSLRARFLFPRALHERRPPLTHSCQHAPHPIVCHATPSRPMPCTPIASSQLLWCLRREWAWESPCPWWPSCPREPHPTRDGPVDQDGSAGGYTGSGPIPHCWTPPRTREPLGRHLGRQSPTGN